MLQIIEAVEGPIAGQLNLAEQAGGEKFSVRAERVYQKAVAQARAVLDKTKLSTLVQGKK